MTATKFYCEEDGELYLEVLQVEKKTVSIYIDSNEEDGDDIDKCIGVHLSIQDAERLMDEIHRAIIKAEGGKNVIH